MICPNCKKETSSLYRICQNCNTDLEQYRSERASAIEGTGETDLGSGFSFESLLINLGPIGGIILMGVAVFWFFAGLGMDKVYFYPPILFIIGIYGFVAGIRRIIKKRALKKKKANGEILD